MMVLKKLLESGINKFIPLFLLVLLSVGCSSDKSFDIKGKLKDKSSHIIEMTYFEDGTLKKYTTHSDENGEWSISGSTDEPLLAFISVSGNQPVATVVVQNGDKLEIEIPSPNATSGIKIKGNNTSETLAKFDDDTYRANSAGKSPDINRRVADFIKNNPNEMASTVLLITRFDSRGNETLADSLLSLISPEVRPASLMQNFSATIASQLSIESRSDILPMNLYDRRDTTIRYIPSKQSYTLFAFIDTDKSMRDSIVPRLKDMREKWNEKRFAEIEVSLALDSAQWKKTVAPDSATWTQAWSPATVASANFRKMAVRRIPFFIVADSTGRQIYRGSSLLDAEKLLQNNLISENDSICL